MPGAPISLETVSDFLIVVDYDAFNPQPNDFMEMSFSLAWLNTIQQEIGPVSVIDSREFQSAELNSYRTVILTASTAEQGSWVPKIRSYLERGGTVVMEMPGRELRSIASADGKGGIRTAQTVTFASGLSETDMQILSELHLSSLTQIVGSAGPLDEAQTWMTIDGVPVVYSKNYATGRVITVDFNFGMLITALQQGRPLDNFEIRNQRDSSHIETSDLAVLDDMKLPVADIFERFIVYGVLNEFMPVVTMWPFFDGMDGALIVTQRETGQGDSSLWMAQYEASFHAASTLFISSPPAFSDEGLDIVYETHTELGLMFDVDSDHRQRALEPIGMFKISPVWRLLNIEDQIALIKARLDEKTPFVTSQSNLGMWHSGYTQSFKILAAAGIKADASYRAPLGSVGYSFATGMPFMPIDTNGLLFNILEFPLTFPEMKTPEQAAELETYLTASETSLHELLAISIEPGEFARKPIAETFQTWQSVYRTATQHKHWVTSILSFFRFSRARYTSELKTRLSDNQFNHKRVQILRIETLAPETGMNVSVPGKIGERVFAEARRGVQRVRDDAVLSDAITTKPVSVMGYERMLVPLNKGFNAIDVIYE